MKPAVSLKKHRLYTASKDNCDAWDNLGIVGDGSKDGAREWRRVSQRRGGRQTSSFKRALNCSPPQIAKS
jgi:hypothetical protein